MFLACYNFVTKKLCTIIMYDGYFDEKGRWIDYTYVNADGEVVDNGYFDKKIKKWIPYGYFDEDGVWKEYN